MYKKIVAVYFSATGNTETYIKACAKSTGLPVEFHNVLSPKAETKIKCQKEDLLLLGAPDYSGRIPDLARKRFQNLRGQGTDAVLLVTFGNRAIDDALLEMAGLVKQNSFTVIGGAGLVGKHTFGEIATDRPSSLDLSEAQKFMQAVLQKENKAEVKMPGNFPYKEASTKGKWHPSTKENCIHCGHCERECPAGAIAPDHKTINENCISCFHCISVCPVQAKEMQGEAYVAFCESLNERLKAPQKNEFYL